MKTCTVCKTQFEDILSACPACGTTAPLMSDEALAAEKHAEKSKKKKKSVMSVIVFLVMVILGAAVGYFNSHSYEFRNTVAPSDSANPSPAFTSILSENGLTDPDNLKDYPKLSHVSYALEDEEGWIFLMEYGVKGDAIVTIFDTVYVPVAGQSDEDIQSFRDEVKKNYADVAALSFAKITEELTDDYYMLSIRLEDMNQWSNIKKAAATKAYEDDVSGEEFYYSIDIVENDMLSQGYKKK